MSLTSRRTVMARKRYKPEEIVAKLRQVDVLVSQGQNMVDAIRQIGVSEVTYYRWRQEFGGLKTEQVKRLKDLELENSRLRKAVSDLTLDKSIETFAMSRMTFFCPAVLGSKLLTVPQNSTRPETPLLNLVCRLARLAGVCPAERAAISPAMTASASALALV